MKSTILSRDVRAKSTGVMCLHTARGGMVGLPPKYVGGLLPNKVQLHFCGAQTSTANLRQYNSQKLEDAAQSTVVHALQ